VADGQAVRDDGRAGGLGLQAGDASGGVHEGVGGGEDLGHAFGEAVDVYSRLGGEVLGEALVELFVAPGQADDRRNIVDRSDLAYGALDVPDAPAAAGDYDHMAILGQGEHLAGLGLGALVEELGGDQGPHQARASLAGDALYGPHRLAVHDEVGVDAGLGPEEQAG